MDTLWKIDITGQTTPGFIFYGNEFAGQFFTAQNHKIYSHNASDGQVLDESPDLPGDIYQVINYKPVIAGGELKLIIYESGTIRLYDISITTGADEPPQSILPSSFTLGAPYPNPFNPTLSIPVELNSKSHLKIEVFNIAGQKVGQVVDCTIPAGQYEYIWDGSKSASGVYFIKASTDDQNRIVKAVLLK